MLPAQREQSLDGIKACSSENKKMINLSKNLPFLCIMSRFSEKYCSLGIGMFTLSQSSAKTCLNKKGRKPLWILPFSKIF
jgi:hypothetical protein